MKQLREEVNNGLDYNPDMAAYRDRVARNLNRHYLQLSGQYNWLFLQPVVDLQLRATVTGSAGVTTVISAGNVRLVTGSGTAFRSDMEGQTFVTPSGTEHTIASVSSATVMYLSTVAVAFAASSSWSIRYDTYALPVDCAQVLGVMSRADDRGRLTYLDRRKEEEEFLDKDQSGDPLVYIEDEHKTLRPPDLPPTLAVSSSGTLVASTKYEYCYTFTYEGRESPPSPVVSATTTASFRTITVAAMENTTWGSGADLSGKLKQVYRRDVTNAGRWFRVVEDLIETDLDHVDDRVLPAYAYNYDDVVVLDTARLRQYVRFWWTAESDLVLQVRYLKQVRRMVADSDYPEWPDKYHHLLVYKVLEDACLEFGMTQQAGIYGGRAEKLLGRMRDKYLSRSDRQYVRRGFDSKLLQPERWGSPVKL